MNPKLIKIAGGVLLTFAAVCLLMLMTGYRVLVGEEREDWVGAQPISVDASGSIKPLPAGSVEIDPRFLAPDPTFFCRYFTGRNIVTVVFEQSDGFDSCPFFYQPTAYKKL